jgi:hypothetical protein
MSGSLSLTLNLITSSIFAVFPSLTQLWKKLGATETPNASDVIPVRALSAFVAITRNVPKRSTSNRWVYVGKDVINLGKEGGCPLVTLSLLSVLSLCFIINIYYTKILLSSFLMQCLDLHVD